MLRDFNNDAPSRSLSGDSVVTFTALNNCKYVINEGYMSYVALNMRI